MWSCCGVVLAAGTALASPWINVDEKRWPLNAWLGQLKNPTPPPPSRWVRFLIIY